MKKILFLLTISIFVFACQKDFGDLNLDTKKPAIVPPGALFVDAQKQLVDAFASPNVNLNVFRLFSQQWAQTTYIDESNYDIATRAIPQNFWNSMNVRVLINLKEAQKLIPTQNASFFPPAVQSNQDACAEILSVLAYSTLVNTFGNIPYSEALDPEITAPKYDDAATVYADLLTRLDRAVSKIDASAGGFGSSDIIFNDNMAAWKSFGNSLKIRLGMIVADTDAAKAKQMVESAFAGAITDNANNAAMHYLSSPPNTNPVWEDLIQSGRKDFVGANTMIDIMQSLNDPRLGSYFTTDAVGGFSGGIYGSNNSYVTFSKPSDVITAPDYPAILFDAAETHFLLAEAAERGMSVGGTAAEHYEAAIKASFTAWGFTEADATAYLSQPAVAYATAPGDWRKKIGTQKWLSFYNRGYEAWTEWRRLDAPTLNVPDGLTYADIPVRLSYPIQEQNLNKANYTSAAAAIGGDVVATKLWWDKF
jgi:hypothetical protein